MRSNFGFFSKCLACAAVAAAPLLAAGPVQAQTLINFDNILAGQIGTQYLNQGVMFFVGNGSQGNSTITNNSAFVTNLDTSISAPNVMIPFPGGDNDIYVQFFSSPGQRTFASLIGITNDTAGTPPVILQAFDFNGNLIGATAPLLGSQAGTLFLSNIYTARIIGQSGVGLPGLPQLGVDNFRFTLSPATAAPEPGSLALLLPVVGMAGMVIRKRRHGKYASAS